MNMNWISTKLNISINHIVVHDVTGSEKFAIGIQCGKCLLRAQRVVEDARLASSSAPSGAAMGATASA